MITSHEQAHDAPSWRPTRPKFRPLHLLVAWLVAAASLLVAAWIVPGAAVNGFLGALAAALAIAVLNAIVPPLLAALRLPFMVLTGLLLILIVDALMLLAADRITDHDLEIIPRVLALGSEAEVLAPASCRASIAVIVRQLAERYAKTE